MSFKVFFSPDKPHCPGDGKDNTKVSQVKERIEMLHRKAALSSEQMVMAPLLGLGFKNVFFLIPDYLPQYHEYPEFPKAEYT